MTPDMLHARLKEVLASRCLTSWFQPIVDFKAGRILGYEAVIRGPSDGPLHAPAPLFETADRFGLLGELELLCKPTSATSPGCSYRASCFSTPVRQPWPIPTFRGVSPVDC